MNTTLQNELEKLFTGINETVSVREFKEEVFADASENFTDLQQQQPTASELELAQKVVAGLGDVHAVAQSIAGEVTDLVVIEQANASNYDTFELDAYAGEIFIARGVGDDFRVDQVLTNDDAEFAVKIENANRHFKVTMPRPTVGGVFGKLKRMGFDWHDKQNIIRIDVPESFKGDMKIKVNAGEVHITDLDLDGWLDLELNAGEVKVKSIKVANIEANIMAGSALFKNVEVAGVFRANVKAGEVELRNVAADFQMSGAAGSIEAKDLMGHGKFSGKAANFELAWQTVNGDLAFETAVGNIEVKLPGKASYHVQVAKSLGDVEIKRMHTVTADQKVIVGDAPTFTVSANATLGNITIK
ncbi:MAG: DUF4097 family beta strand repeat-containing protein [Lactobacillaceae bacterium]|jgi:hypothetical protein|nr:DUF4097 family beta strand repeat-containing protein [Lactobacillaceae bacterium]